MSRILATFVCLFAFALLPAATAAEVDPPAKPTPDQLKFFETKIRPVMVRECYGCHSKQSGQARGGLQLDSREAMLRGGDSGPAIVPKSLEDSLFFGAITHTDFIMPPKRKLSDAEIDDFRRWILDGAPDPRISKPTDSPVSTIDEAMVAEARETFWAYQPLTGSETPKPHSQWATTDIDRFIEDKLVQEGLQPAADAEPKALLRRLCFDLVGLPPAPEQLDWFEKAFDKSPERAVAHVVDSLLDSDQFGEHWGRHWLDVVRYAESTGRDVNMTYPQAWRYRDYVIDAFNQDKPFNEFVQEQLAGDLLPTPDDQQWSQNLVATGFLAIGTKNLNEQSALQFEADLADEQLDATTRIFLGTSVACARCHDHKFDAIRQVDYYGLVGVFGSTKTFFGNPPSEYGQASSPQQRRTSSLILLPVPDENPIGQRYTADEVAAMHDEIASIDEQLAELRRERARGNSAAANAQQRLIRLSNQRAQLANKLGFVDASGNPRSYCMGVQDRDQARDAALLVRGEIDQPAERIPRELPLVFLDEGETLGIDASSSGRLELARWIGSDRSPLTSRVMVNRIWHHVFGQGIVPTTEDFGVTGLPPSHPELLDQLAIDFIESDWSVKTMVRKMMLTRAYRMSTEFNREHHEKDPDNRMLWHSHRKRLGAESIRDAMLAAAGELNTTRPHGSKVAEAGFVRVQSDQLGDPRELIRQQLQTTLASRVEQVRNSRGGRFGNRRRGGRTFGGTPNNYADEIRAITQANSLESVNEDHRSVYLPIVRDFVPRSLDVFDYADPSLISGVRETSNTPNQALYLLNNPLTIRLSESFAERLTREATTNKDRVELAFRLAYGRTPSTDERAASHRFLRDSGLSPKEALEAFCQSLFAAAEFRYLN
ncbi:MAG: PSD1 and planctomycete cytochrome C domain-containing protein [Planctomycetota bacterium]